MVEIGDPGGNLLPVEPSDFGDTSLAAELRRYDAQRLLLAVQLNDQPAAMDAFFAAPVCMCDEVRA